ncbi:phosphotransferase family protein [Plantactinospora mayteni]|uniref:phosphotransferase family protein n=1 Tax=Plantactinospora mayteni TaxID=566021 RepID=UPI001945680F|nr:phosphotransferase [Plantactinospora mayteni]
MTAPGTSDEIHTIAEALGSRVLATRRLAGGFSHETCLVTLADGQVVVRLGGPDPAIEAAVMATARRHVPVPEVLLVLPAAAGEPAARPAMVIEYVSGTPLEQVLAADGPAGPPLSDLGAEVGRVVAGIGTVAYDRPGFFIDEQLTVRGERPWSTQLPEVAASCLAGVPEGRLDPAIRDGWRELCAVHAPALSAVDGHARLVHADVNPKNILVSSDGGRWQVAAVLDWEFGYAGCPYADAANMLRFGADYPAEFVDGFRSGFAGHQPADLPLAADWAYLGRVLDMFALSDLVTRPAGNPVADQAAEVIRHWVADGVPA